MSAARERVCGERRVDIQSGADAIEFFAGQFFIGLDVFFAGFSADILRQFDAWA